MSLTKYIRSLLWVIAFLVPGQVWAVSCNASISDINFGNISLRSGVSNQTSGALTINCSGALSATVGVCISIGSGGGGAGSNNSPRYMTRGANRLPFQLRAQGFGSAFGSWGSVFVNIPTVLGSGSVSIPIYAEIVAAHASAPAGSYSSIFSGSNGASITFGVLLCGVAGSTVSIPQFTVTGEVTSSCELSVTDMNFGTIPAQLTSAEDAEAFATVRCSDGTSYSISVDLGNGIGVSHPAARKLTNGASTLNYGLYQNAARTQPWGNGVGDRVSSSGTGSDQTFSIFGRIHAGQSATFGTYTDSVLVTVEF